MRLWGAPAGLLGAAFLASLGLVCQLYQLFPSGLTAPPGFLRPDVLLCAQPTSAAACRALRESLGQDQGVFGGLVLGPRAASCPLWCLSSPVWKT